MSRQASPLYCTLLGALLFCSGALAADPLVNVPQGNFSCRVKVVPHNAPKPDPNAPERRYAPVLKKVEITQFDGIRRDINSWSDDTSSQLWSIVAMNVSLLESNKAGKEIYVLRGWLRKKAGPALLRLDAKSLSWITNAALTNPPTDDSKPLHYQATVVVSEPGEVPAVTALYQAWIDPETLLPKKLDDGNATYILSFSEAPATPLVMPANIQAELKRWQAAAAPRPHL